MKKESISDSFIEHYLFGKLKIIRVFVRFDIPRTFVCENQINTKYLFSEMDEEGSITKWLVVPISNHKYSQLLRNEIYVRTALMESEANLFYEVILNFKSGEITCNILSKCPKERILQSDFYAGSFSEKVSDLHDILKTSKEEGSPQLDIIVSDEKDSLPGIDSIAMSDIGTKSRLYLSSLYGRPVNPLMHTISGSFVLRINVNEPTNVFDSTDSIKCISVFNKVMKEDNPEEKYKLLDGNRTTTKRYLDFLESLSKINKDIKIVTASPEDDQPNLFNLKHNEMVETRKRVLEVMSKTTKEYWVNGTLMEFNSRKPTFEIMTEDGDHIKGNYDSSIFKPEIIYGVNGRVRGHVRETIYLNSDGTPAKKKHDFLLFELEFIGSN